MAGALPKIKMAAALPKAAIAVPVVLAVSAGAVRLAVDYRAGIDFQMPNTKREMQNNQVLFPDDKTAADSNGQQQDNQDSFWEQDQSDNEPNPSQDNGFLFQQSPHVTPESTDMVGVALPGDHVAAGIAPGQVFDLVNNIHGADTVLTGTNFAGILPNPNQNGDGDNGTGDTVGGSGDEPGGGQSQTPNHLSPAQPSNPGSESGGGSNSGSSDSGNTGTNTTPSTGYGDTAIDPDDGKATPPSLGEIVNADYTESMTPSTGSDGTVSSSIIITKAYNATSLLYAGQSVTESKIFNSLYTFVYGTDNKQYLWGTEHYGTYIRIDAVSFDGGETWVAEFPTAIPDDCPDNTIIIKTSYRLKSTGDWIERDVNYQLEQNRIFILNKTLSGPNEVISADSILNPDNINQYTETGKLLNLFNHSYLSQMFNDEYQLTQLFPGWTENGKPVSWFYPATSGRHILEAAPMVDLNPAYTVVLTYYWMTNDYKVDPVAPNTNLCYMQTLTDYDGSNLSERTGARYAPRLDVPQYVQAVDFNQFNPLIVDTLSLPSSTVYINTTNGGIQVYDSYTVADDNPFYRAQNGVLINRDATQLLGIPLRLTWLDIPSTVTNINLPANNSLQAIHLRHKSISELPDINYDLLPLGCKLILEDDVAQEFMTQYRKIIEQNNLYVASASDPDDACTIRNGFATYENGRIHRLMDTSADTVYLPNNATAISENAFAGQETVHTLILPRDGGAVTLDNGALNNSAIATILCYSQAQYDALGNLPDGVTASLLLTSQEGYAYAFTAENVMLVSVPSNITEFDGTCTAQNGTSIILTAIGNSVFEGCNQLQWATLPEDITYIGKRAFYNCPSLQGILINAWFSITIGDEAFDNCDSLRFIASNAYYADFLDNYDFSLDDCSNFGNSFLYAPSYNTGYTSNWLSFTPDSGIDTYAIERLGDNTRVLCGNDDAGEPILALRSGTMVDDVLTIPDGLQEIWLSCFADTTSPSGSYTIDFSDMENIYLHDRAFYNAAISGDLVLPKTLYLGLDIFNGCEQLENITFTGFGFEVAFYSGMFSGCNNLQSITFDTYDIPIFAQYGSVKFQFNFMWDYDEEAEKLRVIVPQVLQRNYVKELRYWAAGYISSTTSPAYTRMWSDIYDNYFWENFIYPDDETVDNLLEEQLLAAENHVRKLLDMEQISEATDLYHFRISSDGEITLTKTMPSLTVADLNGNSIGLLDGWSLDYIAPGAFSRSKDLYCVQLPETQLVGIYEGAFEGVESEHLTIMNETDHLPELLGFTPGTPFDFGISDDRICIVCWNDDMAKTFSEWIYPLAGYDSMAQMLTMVSNEMLAENPDATNEEIQAEILQRLMVAENRLRVMFDMELIDSPDDMIALGDAPFDNLEPTDPEEPEEPENPDNGSGGDTDTDLPEWPEWPEWPDDTSDTNEPDTPSEPDTSEPPDTTEPDTSADVLPDPSIDESYTADTDTAAGDDSAASDAGEEQPPA